MKKITNLFCSILTICSLASCDFVQNNSSNSTSSSSIETSNLEKLKTPENVTYDETTHQLSWDYIDNATKYEVVINSKTNETYDLVFVVNFTLEQDFYYKIRAIGDGVNFDNSDFTEPKKASYKISDDTNNDDANNDDTNNDDTNNDEEMKKFSNKKYSVETAEELDNGYTLQKSFKDTIGNTYYMFYLGRVHDVPLVSKPDFYHYNGIVGDSKTLSVTYATEESVSTQVANATSRTTSVTNSMTGTFEFSASGGEKDKWSIGVTLSYEWGKTWGESNTSSVEKTYSESVQKSKTESSTVSITFDKTYPVGYYRYIYVGVLDTFVYVIKDTKGNYYVQRESSIAASGYKWDFSPNDETFSDFIPGTLEFDMSIINRLPEPNEITDLVTQDGSAEKPFIIEDISDFKTISRYDGPDTHYILNNDIDFEDNEFYLKSFYGNIDGKGHSIKNININYQDATESVCVGLFANNYGKIENLIIDGANVVVTPDWINKSREIYSGILVGKNMEEATITNCKIINSYLRVDSSNVAVLFEEKFSSDPRTMGNSTNGWTEWMTQSYDNHVNNGSNWDNIQYKMYVGGLAGFNAGTISSCEFVGSVESSLYNMDVNQNVEQIQYTGGLIGWNQGTIDNSIVEVNFRVWLELDNNGNGLGWVGDIYPTATSYLCGISGFNEGIISSKCKLINSELPEIGCRVYAPQYVFLSGANYSSSTKGHKNNIKMVTNEITVEIN